MRQAQELAATTTKPGGEPSNELKDVQLYLQNKAELSVEQTGYMMQPENEIYEMMDRDQIQEMPGEESRQPMLSLGERHELRGEDHVMELDASQERFDPRRYTFDEPHFEDFCESSLTLHEFA